MQADWSQTGIQFAIAMAAMIAGYIAFGIVFLALRRLAARTKSALDDSFARHCAAPVRAIFPLLALDIVMPSLKIPAAIDDPIRHVIGILLIAAVAWLVISLTHVIEDVIVHRFRIDVRDNLKARQIRTQFEVFRRVTEFAVFVIALGIALTTFDWAKTIGTSVLASAGIAGLAASMAARPTIENLVAGLQIALTEPIRIEDVVIAGNEWGWIEEITTTYVVVRTWDLRRLILPLSYFIKTPPELDPAHREPAWLRVPIPGLHDADRAAAPGAPANPRCEFEVGQASCSAPGFRCERAYDPDPRAA